MTMNPPTRNKRKIAPISSHFSSRNNNDDDDDLVKIQSFRDSTNKTKEEEHALTGVEINAGESKKQSWAILSFLIFVVDCIAKCLATIFNKKSTTSRRGRRAGPNGGCCSTQDKITMMNDDYTIPAAIHNNTTEDTSKEKSDPEESGYSSYLHSSTTEEDEERGKYEKQEQGPHLAYTSGTIRTDHHDEEGQWSSEKEGDWVHDRGIAYGRESNGHEDVHEQDGVVFKDQPVSEGDYIHGQVVQGERTQQVRSDVNFNLLDRLRNDDLDSGLHAQRSIYKGEFRHGKCHGHGKMTWYDGGWYVGEWHDGTMHGYGKEIRPDGSLRHNGAWSQGHPIRASTTAGSISSASELIAIGPDDEKVLVIKKQILDSYGQKVGVYTGELSKSTGRPHGKGCLEYRQQARSGEDDSMQGSITGYGGISISDADLQEGGLKNHSNDESADSALNASEEPIGQNELATKAVVLAQLEEDIVRLRQKIHDCEEKLRLRGGMDDAASGVSQESLQSVSASIKSLPREIDLMDDDDDDDDPHTNDDYEPDDDARSVGSRSAASRASRRSIVSGTRSRGQPQRTAREDTINNESAVPLESDPSEGESEDEADILTDTLLVTDEQIIDPYGEKGVYTGALSKSSGMPNGKGLLEYEKKGRWYEGDRIHGRWTGYGRLSNGDGDFYEGGLKNDHKHGTGVMRFADGRVFEGEYIRGQMIHGKMTYQDGSVYVGSWVDGMRHGRGKCIFVDGSEYEGEFREGTFHGYGQMRWNDGGWYVGEWSDGEMHGRGKEILPDGSLRHEGEWCRGQPIRRSNGK